MDRSHFSVRLKAISIILACFTLLATDALAHTPFKLVSSEKRDLTTAQLTKLKTDETTGKLEGSTITYTGATIRIVVITGQEGDPLSFQIQGLRNPNIVVPAGATLRVLLVNTDPVMPHDMRFGDIHGEFSDAPDIATTVGSMKLPSMQSATLVHAEELVITCTERGSFKYFCSVRGHARDGMWGNILVGVQPRDDLKMAPKKEHVHSENEDDDHNAHHHDPEATSKDSLAHDDHAAPAHQHSSPNEHQAEAHEDDQEHDHSQHGHEESAGHMRSSVNIGEPMSREGSGTSWIPDASPMYAWMKMFNDGGQLMLHGVMFPRYTTIGSTRDVSVAGKGGRSRFDAPSMFMGMYSMPLSESTQLGLRAMLSLDPIIERGYGYPLLYQSGELFGGEPLHDRQHPHDFISELAASFSVKLGSNSFYLYAGLPGEPALGPPMYLHRTSGMNMPDAPIGHHWQDATHITFGVLTAAYTFGNVKVELSAFNGTEPDEDRWAFDKPKINSYSARMSINPTDEWSFQLSHGYIKEPERAEPEIDVLRRTTASAIHNVAIGTASNIATTLVWGQNATPEEASNAFLLESAYEFGWNAVFGRAELVQKNSHELVLPAPHPEGDIWVHAYSLGYLREILKDDGIDIGLGVMGKLNVNPESISDVYGGTQHFGWQVYLRLRPSRNQMH